MSPPTIAPSRVRGPPDTAYALAPSMLSEMRWVTNTLATAECFTELERDYYLCKVALLDRIAFLDEPAPPFGDATTAAEAAAVFLLDTDRDHLAGHVVERADRGPRGYVRQQYALHAACVCNDLGEGPWLPATRTRARSTRYVRAGCRLTTSLYPAPVLQVPPTRTGDPLHDPSAHPSASRRPTGRHCPP